MQYLIELREASRVYHLGEVPVRALDAVTVGVAAGEFAAVWGPSGSGKTTLLNMLCLIDRPSTGQLLVKGNELSGLNDAELSQLRSEVVGIVFQSYNLLPVLSAIENVMLPLQIRGVSEREARKQATFWLKEVELSHLADQYPDKMSGGQRQRVAIARALVGDPALVLADEPTANLDRETAERIVGLMRRLNEERNVTFVFSTHDARLLEQVKRKIRLEDGRISDDSVLSDALPSNVRFPHEERVLPCMS